MGAIEKCSTNYNAIELYNRGMKTMERLMGMETKKLLIMA
jgi:hypothetical protein